MAATLSHAAAARRHSAMTAASSSRYRDRATLSIRRRLCQRKRRSSARGAPRVREKLRARRPERSCARRSITRAKASTRSAAGGKPSRSACRRRAARVSEYPGVEEAAIKRDRVYRVGAYGVYPLLAGGGGELLSRETSALGIAAASLLLACALGLLIWLGRYCGRCNERLGPRLLRLIAMPGAVLTSLAVRSAQSQRQVIAFALIGASIVVFGLAWRWAVDGNFDPEKR